MTSKIEFVALAMLEYWAQFVELPLQEQQYGPHIYTHIYVCVTFI